MPIAIEITDETEIQAISRVRRAVFGGTDREPLKHLGEAETCFLILERSEFAGAWWLSDDQEAVRYARFRGITTRETVDLMSMAVVDGDIGADEAFALLRKMADSGRSLRLPRTAAELRR